MYTKGKKSRNIKFSGTLLKSGAMQLKFQFFENGEEKLYGYKLVDDENSLESNINFIKDKIKSYCKGADLHHAHLYNLDLGARNDAGLLIYKR